MYLTEFHYILNTYVYMEHVIKKRKKVVKHLFIYFVLI